MRTSRRSQRVRLAGEILRGSWPRWFARALVFPPFTESHGLFATIFLRFTRIHKPESRFTSEAPPGLLNYIQLPKLPRESPLEFRAADLLAAAPASGASTVSARGEPETQ